MAERLTEKNSIENKRYMLNSEDNTVCVTNARLTNCATIAYCWGKPIDKLAQLEDILEKYDLEVEELDERIYNGAFNYIDKLKAETDRDTWQRACELACDVILRFTDGCPCKADYFYQQAKKENKKVQIHYCTNDETNKILGDIKIKDDFSTTMQNLAKICADTLKDLDTAEDKDN